MSDEQAPAAEGWPQEPGWGGEDEAEPVELEGDAHTWHRSSADEACGHLAALPEVFLNDRRSMIWIDDARGGLPTIRPVEAHVVPDLLGRANVVCFERTARGRRPVAVPGVLCQTVVSRRSPGVPWKRFKGFASGPYMLRTGEIVQRHGFAPERGLWLPHHGICTIPETGKGSVKPKGFASWAEGRAALQWLLEPLKEFPWQDPELDPAVWLSYLFTLAMRPAFEHAPLFLFEASLRRSGKDLLLKCAEMAAHGQLAKRIDAKSGNEEEIAKTIGSAFLEGHTTLIFGDVARLGSSLILGLITEPELQTIRLLGANSSIAPPITLTLGATANNVKFPLPDLIPRTIALRLSPRTENPEYERHEKTQMQLLALFRERRSAILAAVFNAVRGFIHRSVDPETEPDGLPCGTFPVWASLVRDPLMYYGFPDVLLTQRRLAAQVPVGDQDAMASLFGAWWALLRDREGVTSSMLIQMAAQVTQTTERDDGGFIQQQDPDRVQLSDALGLLFDGKPSPRKLTEKLQELRDTPMTISGYRLRFTVGIAHNQKVFRLQRVE